MRGVVDSLAAVYQTLYSAGFFLTEVEHAALKRNVEEFGQHYLRLRELSRRSGLLAFGITPKVHKVQHLPLVAQSLNPRWCQNYAEEATMGTVSLTWRGSARGRYQDSVQEVVLAKRLLSLLLRFELWL